MAVHDGKLYVGYPNVFAYDGAFRAMDLSGKGFLAGNFVYTTVPEPTATVLAMMSGLVTLGITRRRRK